MTDEAEALRVAAVVDLAQRAHDFSGEPVELFVRHETLDGVPHIRIVTDPASILLPVSAARIVFGALLPPAPVPAGAGALDQETRAFLMHAWRRHIHVSRVPLSKEEVAALFEEELIALPIESGQEDDWFFTDKGLELAKRLFDLPAPPSGGMTEGSLAYDVETRRFEVAELRKGRLGLSAPDRDAILADVEAILERVLAHLSPASDQDRQAGDQNSQEPDGGDHG